MIRVPVPGESSGHYHLVYDAWNRVVAVWNGVESYRLSEIEYDGLNRRIVKVGSIDGDEAFETRHCFYNDRWQCLEERWEDNEEQLWLDCQYVWSERYIDAMILRDRDSDSDGDLDERLYALSDANYNVTAVIGEDGTVAERYLYDAYGEVTILDPGFTLDADNASDYAWQYLYTGRQLDTESGLMYYRNRYYHTGLGRFVSRDPVGYEGSEWNLYEYVESRPLIGQDAFGLCGGTCGNYGPTGNLIAVAGNFSLAGCIRRETAVCDYQYPHWYQFIQRNACKAAVAGICAQQNVNALINSACSLINTIGNNDAVMCVCGGIGVADLLSFCCGNGFRRFRLA